MKDTPRTRLPFTKMHGAGNDYVFVDAFAAAVAATLGRLDLAELARRVSDRHRGVGGDGLIVLEPARDPRAACAMRMWNADGSRGAMCGNGLRCLAWLAHDQGRVRATEFSIETDAGLRGAVLRVARGRVESVCCDMGRVSVERAPLRVEALGRIWELHRGDAGNPHAVLFVPDVETAPVHELGALLQRHAAFPGGVNVEFVQPLAEDTLAQRTFERGSGETLACGTGACAAALAAIATGRARGPRVRVRLRGGELSVTRRDQTVELEGETVVAFRGELELGA